MKHVLAKLAIAAALMGPAFIGGASAAPAGSGLALAAEGVSNANSLVEQVWHRGYHHGHGWRHGHRWRGGPHYGYGYGRPFYGYGHGYGRRCRTVIERRFSPGWGWRDVPVRICR